MTILTDLFPGAEWLPFVGEMTVKATLVLVLTAAVAGLLWRASAAVRHMVWSVGVIGVLALPLLSVLLPAWEVPLIPTSSTAPMPIRGAGVPAMEAPIGDVPAASPAAPLAGAAVPGASSPLSAPADALDAGTGPLVAASSGVAPALPEIALALATAGVLVGLLWLAVGFWGVSRIGRSADVVRDPEWIRAAQESADHLGLRRPVLLLRSRGTLMPATWGLLWPSVVVPSTADAWPDDRRRAVLAHELAHVKRFDCLTQALAQVACALLWWHPVVWYAARRLRVERERACDDLVLRAGARPSDYAAHLLEVARSHRTLRLGAPALVSMAKPSHLESRLLWILDGARARSVPSMRVIAAAALVGLVVVAPLSAMRPTERGATQPAVVSGIATTTTQAVESAASAMAAHPGASPAAPTANRAGKTGAPSPTAVDTPYTGALRAAGYTDLSIDDLIAMKAVGVTPGYVSEMNAAGLGRLTGDQLVGLRALGVAPAYVSHLRDQGFTNLTVDDVMGMKALGVSSRYIEEMQRAGFGELSADDLTDLRAVGVTREYVEELRRQGLGNLSADDVQSLRAIGVSGEYIARMKALGLGRLDADALTDLRAMGVTPAYAQELAGAGLKGLSLDHLVELKAHGVTAAYVREMSEAGLGPFTVDQLIRLRASGLDRDLMEDRRGTRTRSEP